MPEKISNTFVNYFRSNFASPNVDNGRPFLHTQMPHDINDFTYSIPDEEEVLTGQKVMKRNASPGPNGFNVEFYIAT
jgi:hypothetical protein